MLGLLTVPRLQSWKMTLYLCHVWNFALLLSLHCKWTGNCSTDNFRCRRRNRAEFPRNPCHQPEFQLDPKLRMPDLNFFRGIKKRWRWRVPKIRYRADLQVSQSSMLTRFCITKTSFAHLQGWNGNGVEGTRRFMHFHNFNPKSQLPYAKSLLTKF